MSFNIKPLSDDDYDVVLLEWVISNFKFKNKTIRKEALYMLIETITSLSSNLGKKYIYSLLKNKPLIELYKELGYIQGESNATEMIKKI